MPPKRPRDPNQRAKLIVDIATGEAQEEAPASSTEAGRKGGKTRANRMTAEQRSDAARKAAQARWSRHS